MGYTHYWKFRDVAFGDRVKVLEAYKKACLDIGRIAKAYNADVNTASWERLSGYTAHTKPGLYDGVKLNGKDSESHEDFILRERYELNEGFNFCKTARKPYDVVVCAALIVLKHRLKDYVDVSSDGESDDWQAGLELASKVLGLKRLKVPDGIRLSMITSIPHNDTCKTCGQPTKDAPQAERLYNVHMNRGK